MRLTILNNETEIVSVEGNGSVVLPAVLFMRPVVNTVHSHSSSRASSKTGSILPFVSNFIENDLGAHKRSASNSRQESIGEIVAMNKEISVSANDKIKKNQC